MEILIGEDEKNLVMEIVKLKIHNMAACWYFVKIRINMGYQDGIDLPGTVDKVRNLLLNYPNATRCVHKYKVTGESTIVAVYEVTNVIGLERMVSGLARLGNMDVTCQPLKPYEKFAEMLQVDRNLTKPSTNCLAGDKQLFWLEFRVEYPDKSMEQLIQTWQREAAFALGARASGTHLELFKVLGERRVHVFVAMDPDNLDTLTFNLPVMKENGCNTFITSRAVQCLDDYVSKISSDTL